MQPISINDYLNSNNAWALRLLGFSGFQKKRDVQQVENEYNLDKYARLLELELPDMEAYKRKGFELGGLSMESVMPISFGDEIFRVPVPLARMLFYNLIQSKLQEYASEHLCELGCGYGFNLSYLGRNTYGGEYSKNAVLLGQKLGMEIREFNYYKSEDYGFIKPGSTVFTTHSIEQIPDASVIISSLEKQKEKINYVVHFEPTVVKERTNLMGLMRNKYMELNDYNRNLVELLQTHPAIEVLELQYDVFGLNPLNSSNLVVWKFKK